MSRVIEILFVQYPKLCHIQLLDFCAEKKKNTCPNFANNLFFISDWCCSKLTVWIKTIAILPSSKSDLEFDPWGHVYEQITILTIVLLHFIKQVLGWVINNFSLGWSISFFKKWCQITFYSMIYSPLLAMICCHQAAFRCLFSNFLNLILTWEIFLSIKAFCSNR